MGDKSAFVGGMKLKISELGKVITGNTPSKKIKEFWDKDDVGFVKPDIISDEHIVKIKSEDCNEFISNAAISKARIVPKNSIFVTCIGNIGKIGVATENLAFNQQINAIIPNENVNLDYLCYAIFANKTRLQDIANAPIVPLLNKSQFSEFELEFDMDINTQTRIVHELNTVSNIILKYKQELLLLDELVRARFVEMFGDPFLNEKGWITKPLIDMGNCKNGMNFHYNENGCEVKCLGVGDFKDLSIINNIESLQTVSLNEMPSEEYMLRDNDIVFVRSNGNKALVGRSIVIYPGDVPTTFSGFCIRYRKYDDSIIVPYLLHVLKTDSFRNKMVGRGANIQNLNQQILASLIIPVPPLELQNQFASFVEEIDKSRLLSNHSLFLIKSIIF